MNVTGHKVMNQTYMILALKGLNSLVRKIEEKD